MDFSPARRADGVVPPLAVLFAILAAGRAAESSSSLEAAALGAAVAAGVLGSRREWRRRAALAALLTAVLFVATVSLPFFRPRTHYRKVDARRLPVPDIDAT